MCSSSSYGYGDNGESLSLQLVQCRLSSCNIRSLKVLVVVLDLSTDAESWIELLQRSLFQGGTFFKVTSLGWAITGMPCPSGHQMACGFAWLDLRAEQVIS